MIQSGCAIAIFVLFMALMVYVPYSALADSIDVTSQNPVSCGPHCVIETKGFTSAQEAYDFSKDKTGASVYKTLKTDSSFKWFVDYQVSEEEANSIQ